MKTCRFCPAEQGVWTRVSGGSAPAPGVHAWYRKGGDITIPEWINDAHSLRLTPRSIEVSQEQGQALGQFRLAIAKLGFDPALVENPQEQIELKKDSKLIWTDGNIEENGSNPAVWRFSFLIEYRLSEICNQGGTPVRIVATKAGEDIALTLLAYQAFGEEVDSEAIRIVKDLDIEAALSFLQAYPDSYRKSNDILYVGWGAKGFVPIIEDRRLKPKGSGIATVNLIWTAFGLAALENSSFEAVLSTRQREFKKAFEASNVNPAIDYLLKHHSVLRCQNSPSKLAIDGVPIIPLSKTIGAVSLLFERFSSELKQRLLSDFRTKKGSQLTVVYPSGFHRSHDNKQWEPARSSLPPIAVSQSCMLTLHGKGTLEREFRKRLVRLDQSTENNGANGIPFYMKESDTLRGIVNSGSGHAFVSGSNVLLSPSEGGMMVILLVEKSDEGGTIVPFGCYVTPDPGGLWARLRRATFNKSLPLRFSLNNETKPRVIVGLDGANKPWACEVTADDSSV